MSSDEAIDMAAATARGTSDACISPTIDEQSASAILYFGPGSQAASQGGTYRRTGPTTTHSGTSRRDWSGRASGDS